jgi:hypothetical protein
MAEEKVEAPDTQKQFAELLAAWDTTFAELAEL